VSVAALLVALTCVVASVSYIGAVTQGALASMLLPVVLLAGLVAGRFRDRPIGGLLAAGTTALVGGEVVNVLSGNFQGPVARGTFVAALLTGVAVLVTGRRVAAAFLLPVVGILAWALALGAGGRVELVAVVTAAFALLSLAAVERERRSFESPPRTAPSVLAGLALVAVAGVFAGRYQLAHDHRTPASPFRSTLSTTVIPPAVLSLTRHPPRSATAPLPTRDPRIPAVVQASASPSLLHRVLLRVGEAFAGLLALALLGLLLRLFWVAVAWKRLGRRLRRRSEPTEAGAWAWALATLDRLGQPVSPSLSPDLAAEPEAALSDQLRELAQTVTPAVFGPPRDASHGTVAWSQAKAVHDDAWKTAGRWHRARARCVSPRRDRLAS
jgi:hypothetical protein